MRQVEGRRRKSDLRTQPVIDAEAWQAKLGLLSDARKPSRAWSRTRAPRAIGRRGDLALSRNTPRRGRATKRHQAVGLFFLAQIAWRATPSMRAASSFVTTPRENTRWKPCMKWSACSGFMKPIS